MFSILIWFDFLKNMKQAAVKGLILLHWWAFKGSLAFWWNKTYCKQHMSCFARSITYLFGLLGCSSKALSTWWWEIMHYHRLRSNHLPSWERLVLQMHRRAKVGSDFRRFHMNFPELTLMYEHLDLMSASLTEVNPSQTRKLKQQFNHGSEKSTLHLLLLILQYI